MDHFEELQRSFFGARWHDPVLGAIGEVIDTCVLVVEGFVEDAATETGFGEHAFDERFEFHEAMVKLSWNGTLELVLVCLETVAVSLMVCLFVKHKKGLTHIFLLSVFHSDRFQGL